MSVAPFQPETRVHLLSPPEDTDSSNKPSYFSEINEEYTPKPSGHGAAQPLASGLASPDPVACQPQPSAAVVSQTPPPRPSPLQPQLPNTPPPQTPSTPFEASVKRFSDLVQVQPPATEQGATKIVEDPAPRSRTTINSTGQTTPMDGEGSGDFASSPMATPMPIAVPSSGAGSLPTPVPTPDSSVTDSTTASMSPSVTASLTTSAPASMAGSMQKDEATSLQQSYMNHNPNPGSNREPRRTQRANTEETNDACETAINDMSSIATAPPAASDGTPSVVVSPPPPPSTSSAPGTRASSISANSAPTRPVLNRYYSLPTNPVRSPSRQHFRLHNAVPHHVKETPRVAYLEDARGKFVNQYLITRVVGRGSFGMVYLAVDPEGQRYALKECSKQRLAKMNRAAMMRLRRQIVTRGSSAPTTSEISSLIKREIAIMKKLDHPNLVTLYEVLDDPSSESLILVLEWCPEGTIMPAEEDYDGHATPIPEPRSRLYFRDLILGVEYLHARGVCHRDIKADNVLLGEGDVVKIADFGVSEIFDLTSNEDSVLRPVGSPAYMSPELVLLQTGGAAAAPGCSSGNGGGSYGTAPGTSTPNSPGSGGRTSVHPANAPISGRRADVWAMGVTLYYMIHGRLPFEAPNIALLHHNILTTDPDLSECSPELADLFRRIFAKVPANRISLNEIRNHPWVTQNGLDPLLPVEENVQVSNDDIITEEDLVTAIDLIKHNHPTISQLDFETVMRSLRAHYGWHGSLNGSLTSSTAPSGARTPSTEYSQHPDGRHSSQDSLKMEKLSRALEELLKK